MTSDMTVCPIWGDPYPATIAREAIRGPYLIVDSPRAGGKYQIADRAAVSVRNLDDEQKARLTTLLVDEHRQGGSCPKVDTNTIEDARNNAPLSVKVRAERLLGFLVGESRAIGSRIPIHDFAYAAYAWSESTQWSEVEYLVNSLANNQWVKLDNSDRLYYAYIDGKKRHVLRKPVIVTISGYGRVQDRAVKTSSSQAFVAMWFDSSMNETFTHGLEPGITDAGYQPLRVDHKADVNKIDDDIIDEIRRSRFLVADFTHGDEGARGGVYYETGFAHGLGLQVIFTCRKDLVEQLHFDTRQYHHIVWETPDELRRRLKERILALIGEGPGEGVTVT